MDNVRDLDSSQRPLYLLFCLQRWLNIVLDLLVAAIAVGAVWLTVKLRGTTSGAQIGIALNIVLVANTTLLRLVTSWTSLEVSLGAVARLKSLETNTSKEDKPCENASPPIDWPQRGDIELKDVSVAYNPKSMALRNINLTISAGQKVIICGRTGSGKSTLILTLLRLLDLQSGSITIDGLDLSRVPRPVIREQCFIVIPQDPLLLPDQSLRSNIDPSEALPDEALVSALEQTQLWTHLTQATRDSRWVLDLPLAALPPLSTGQCQLLSLARAMLRRKRSRPSSHAYSHAQPVGKPILLLDEPTASLDGATERIVNELVYDEFTRNGHTVIIVAHRIGALVDDERSRDDVVVLMSDGRVEKAQRVEEMFGASR
ncbi:hypothetical protein MBLNU459_g3011t2 [Dothideomycetes sp. NU459]